MQLKVEAACAIVNTCGNEIQNCEHAIILDLYLAQSTHQKAEATKLVAALWDRSSQC